MWRRSMPGDGLLLKAGRCAPIASIEPKKPLDVFVRCSNSVTGEFAKLKVFIIQLAGVGSLACGKDVTKPAQAASHVHRRSAWFRVKLMLSTPDLRLIAAEWR